MPPSYLEGVSSAHQLLCTPPQSGQEVGRVAPEQVREQLHPWERCRLPSLHEGVGAKGGVGKVGGGEMAGEGKGRLDEGESQQGTV